MMGRQMHNHDGDRGVSNRSIDLSFPVDRMPKQSLISRRTDAADRLARLNLCKPILALRIAVHLFPALGVIFDEPDHKGRNIDFIPNQPLPLGLPLAPKIGVFK